MEGQERPPHCVFVLCASYIKILWYVFGIKQYHAQTKPITHFAHFGINAINCSGLWLQNKICSRAWYYNEWDFKIL
jgi:hypothetical protein